MQKPDKQIDSLEEIENILSRLAPSAMSKTASLANDSMIDNLVKEEQGALARPLKRQHWWHVGIAATLMAGAGFALLRQDASDNTSDFTLNGNKSEFEYTSEEMVIDQYSGDSLYAVGFQEKIINELTDKKNGDPIQTGRLVEGLDIGCASKF